MELKFRDYIYLIFITITPFLFILLSLKLFANQNLIMNNSIFWLLISILILIFIITLIISLMYTINHINNQKKGLKKIIHIILLFIFNIVYIPFYYGLFIAKEKFIGLLLPVINMGTIIVFSFASSFCMLNYFKRLDEKNIIVSNDISYLSTNNLFTINVTSNYRCNNDLGNYVVACDNDADDSFLGIYSYNYGDYTSSQLDDIYNFHLEQTQEYIYEAGFIYEEIIVEELVILKYDNMSVLYMGIDYDIDNDLINDYRLIIIKEVPNNENIVSDFNELINSIEFVGNN